MNSGAERRINAAERLHELAEAAELMGDDDAARQFRERADELRTAAMRLLD